ncbi:MAG: DUF3098 domain-containing protein [Calditrichaeota bacterium]|nr:DUF3098 domain-containing protein [Calditrichota bacterium]
MTDKKGQPKRLFPLLLIGRKNLLFYIIGVVVLALGFILMSIPPWDSFLSRTLAPLALLVAYVVIFPIAILYKSWAEKPKGGSEK